MDGGRWTTDDGRRSIQGHTEVQKTKELIPRLNNGLYRPSYPCQVIHA